MRTLLTTPSRKALGLIALVSGVASGVFLRKLSGLVTPQDTIRFQLAGSAERAKQLFAEWGDEGMAAAGEALRRDFGLLVSYPFLLGSLTLLAARAAPERYAKAGVWLALAPFAAAAFDVIENLALLRVLESPGHPSTPLLQLAAGAAGVKFVLLIAPTGYALAVGLSRLMWPPRALAPEDRPAQ